METIYHIPTEIEKGEPNNRCKALFLVPCAICKRCYEVREGQWLPVTTAKGTELKVKVCSECYANEMQ